MDEMDEDEMAFLQEQEDAFGHDEDEEEIMYMMEQDDVGAGGAGAGAGATQVSDEAGRDNNDNTQPGGANDDDLEWLAQAGATQPTQGIAGGAGGAGGGDGFDDDEDEDADPDEAIFAAPRPTPLQSNARSDAPKLDATAVTGQAVSVTTADGRRAFVRVDASATTTTTASAGPSPFFNAAMTNKTSLLSQPIDAMLDRIEAGLSPSDGPAHASPFPPPILSCHSPPLVS